MVHSTFLISSSIVLQLGHLPDSLPHHLQQKVAVEAVVGEEGRHHHHQALGVVLEEEGHHLQGAVEVVVGELVGLLREVLAGQVVQEEVQEEQQVLVVVLELMVEQVVLVEQQEDLEPLEVLLSSLLIC